MVGIDREMSRGRLRVRPKSQDHRRFTHLCAYCIVHIHMHVRARLAKHARRQRDRVDEATETVQAGLLMRKL